MHNQNNTNHNKPVNILEKYILPILVVAVLILAVAIGVVYLAKSKPELLGISTTVEKEEEAQDIVKKVSELILLPEGETPTIATVSDLTKVQSQEFFQKAQNGDKVLVYREAKKAYLYRPSTHKIIEVGVVNITDEGQVGGAEPQNSIPEIITPAPLPTSTSVPSSPTSQPLPTN